MKVLFAVSNENISTQIVKKFQKDYKEIISYKNMYYFDAIIKELQRDKSYDRIVISEDLEPFSNNNYDAIDKFLFEKLDNISDEATGRNGEDIPIILITTERRMKSDKILIKFFGIGIYNALLGQDRNTNTICALLNKPRGKKEAKAYYQIESEEVDYKSESEETVSEPEIQNILNHYKRLGKDEDKYLESFNIIAAQYNDTQLRIITKYLPLNVKAVLEERSPKYQSIMTFADVSAKSKKVAKKEDGISVGFLKNTNTSKLSNPVIVPREIRRANTKKVINPIDEGISKQREETRNIQQQNIETAEDFEPVTVEEEIEENNIMMEPVKKGRGRPKKILTPEEQIAKENKPKRGRGRPKKNADYSENIEAVEDEAEEIDDTVLPGFEEIDETDEDNFEYNIQNEKNKSNSVLPGFDDIDDLDDLDEEDEERDVLSSNGKLPGFDDINLESQVEDTIPQNPIDMYSKPYSNNVPSNSPQQYNNSSNTTKFSGVLSKDKKIVCFVGTTKNGTSFLVNNVAKSLSSMGIKTAILDLTVNKNAYYVYTNNEEKLRNIALESIENLSKGSTGGVEIDKCLDVYTALPGDNINLNDVNTIVSTLTQNYSVVLIDCDFNTPSAYFDVAQEIYVVQTMDILTIQPMTAFLRDLKAKDILKQDKIRIVINKELKVRGLAPKDIIGGLAFYNDPAMAFMTELFNKESVKYCIIPFEEDVYSKYLESVMNCEISINGYSKNFNAKLKELVNMVYPLIGNKNRPIGDYSSGNNKFSNDMNNTLEQMKKRY